MAVTTTGYKIGKQPIAQSFYVDEPAGIYCTKIDLFLKLADESAPIQVQIRPMINGFPSSSRIIPGSVKSLPGSTFSGGASVSSDATTATTFEFDEPIFLKGLLDYALVVVADSKDYEIYIAEINEFVVGSTEKRINKQPTLGSLFYSQNGSTFTPAQNQDLTFKLYQAKFKHSTATISLKNASLPKQTLTNNPLITTKNSQTVRVFHPNHGMQVGQPIVLSGVDSNGVGGIFASTLNKRYNVVSADHTGYTFTADSSADSDATGGGSLVQSTKNILYDTIYPNFASIVPQGQDLRASIKTTSGKSYAGTETAFQKETSFKTVKLNENNTGGTLRLVAHDSAETSELGAGVKSLDMELKIFNADSNVAPMIDLQRSSVGLISNIIDKQASSITTGFNVPINFEDELEPTGGSSAAKHLTKAITLANSEVGLKILIGANIPTACDIQVFIRTCLTSENIRQQSFLLISPEEDVGKSDNPFDFRQHTFLAGGLGGDIVEFEKFQIKIVMRSTNQAEVPIISQLRAIALST